MTIAETIQAAHRADDDFSRILKAYGYKSRWDWNPAKDDRAEILDYYKLKVAADQAMHAAFIASRST